MWNPDALKGNKTFTDLIEFVFVGNKDPKLFSLVIWNLWNHRNNLRLGKAALPLDKILEHSQERQIEALTSPATSSLHRSQQQASWSPPNAPQCKINYDATTFAKGNKAGLEVVIRNSEGLVMASLTQQLPLPATMIEIEALATQRVIELALEIGLDKIVLESDNIVLVCVLAEKQWFV
nr:uncharacterized protein LOC111997285 [Quercus suber]